MDISLYKKIVVKLGTSTLTYDNGRLNLGRIEKIVRAVSDIKNRGSEVILVSSGAVSAGCAKLHTHRPVSVEEKQAMAAVGQADLMRIYDRFFTAYGHQVAQILLTRSVVENDVQRQNAANTFAQLLTFGCVPIVNENDSVSYEEIRFGGNDTLSAYVAILCGADLLVNFSDIDGLFTKNPREYADATLIPHVYEITDEILSMAGGKGTERGTGGMKTKLQCAKMVTEAGIPMVIANGEDPNVLYDIISGKAAGTLFHPIKNK